jgi:Domain of unknown function (DUF4386)
LRNAPWTLAGVKPLNAVDESQRTAARIVGFTALAVIAPAVFAADATLIAALYVVLKPVNRTLALLAVFWGLIETATLVVVTLNDFDVLRVFGADRLQVLARLSLGAHGAGYNVGLTFAGLRSTAFAYLWFKSRYIPRGLAVWGIFSSLLLALCTFAFVIFPELAKVITVGYYGAPIFIFEVTMGVWLLRKGIAS